VSKLKRQDATYQDYRQGIGHADDRKGLGYGLSNPSGRFAPRQLQGDFPYIDPDEYADVEDDAEILDPEDLDAFVRAVNIDYNPVDYLDTSKHDPFYFVAGNTKLGEALGISTGLSPMPDLYKNRQASVGGGAVPARTHPINFLTRSRPVGSKKGFSTAPPPLDIIEDDPMYQLDDLKDEDERALGDLRKLVAMIHRQQGTPGINSE
jgi:hypothetical protein